MANYHRLLVSHVLVVSCCYYLLLTGAGRNGGSGSGSGVGVGVVSAASSSATAAAATTTAAAAAADDASMITCRTGWTEGSKTEESIPKEWINDGYCDCPFDGKDEPDTNACSGSISWPGVDSLSSSSSSSSPSSASSAPSSNNPTDFACPQQPNVVLPLSRLHDGICDCCDGSDEDPRLDPKNNNKNNSPPPPPPQQKQQPQRNPCPDTCAEDLRAERERMAKLHNDYHIGSRKRATDLDRFAKIRSSKTAEISKQEERLEAIRREIGEIEGTEIVKLKADYAASRADTMERLVVGGPPARALLSGLETSELRDLLVHLCQVAGEIAKSDNRIENSGGCLALRVAALDQGLTWISNNSNNNDDNGGSSGVEATFQEPTSAEIASILFENAIETKDTNLPPLRFQQTSSSSNTKTNKRRSTTPEGRRRLDEMEDDDFMMEDDDNYMRYHRDDDDDLHEEELDMADVHISPEVNDRSEGGADDKEQSEVRASLFSATRVRFLKESQAIVEEIRNILDNAPQPPAEDTDKDKDDVYEEDSNNEKDESESSDTTDSTFDPTAYTMLRNGLREKREIVEKGFSWGASAALWLDAPLQKEEPPSSVSMKRDVLEKLVIGTIYYGQISSLQIWQILQTIMPEFKVVPDETETTCASPWAGNCPPRTVHRLGAEYPPASLFLKVARTFCDEEASNFGNEAAAQTELTCSANNDGGDGNIRNLVESLVSLPSGEGNQSYYGYVVPIRRDRETDALQTMFQPIIDLPINSQGLIALEDKRDKKESEHGTLSSTIQKSWKEIGNRDGKALGRDGEIHSINNRCFSVVAGKYTYEACVFGKAQQKEGSAKSGTNLGQWKGIEYYDINEERDGVDGSGRVLKWENGAKCWNGPKRSATVYMKCGPEHKLISADEPDTCRYVFVMESYLACDEVYRRKLGL